MIDFIKLDISHMDRKTIKAIPGLEFISEVSHETGAIKYPEQADYKGLKITLYKKKTYLSGSIHKYYNGSQRGCLQNYSDFDLAQLKEAISLLKKDFGIDPKKARIVNLEFGVNIDLDYSPTNVIDENVFSFQQTQSPNISSFYNGKGRYIQFNRSQYQLKFYDKGRQYELDGHKLRVEIKTVKAQHLQRLGIYCLDHLENGFHLVILRDEFLKRFDNLLILDSFEPNACPKYWNDLRKTRSFSTFKRRWTTFLGQKDLEGRLKLKALLRSCIESKWNMLLSIE